MGSNVPPMTPTRRMRVGGEGVGSGRACSAVLASRRRRRPGASISTSRMARVAPPTVQFRDALASSWALHGDEATAVSDMADTLPGAAPLSARGRRR